MLYDSIHRCAILAFSILVVTGEVCEAQPKGDFVRLRVDGPAVPYRSIEYVIESSRGVITARTTRYLLGSEGSVDRLVLLEPVEWQDIKAKLRATGGFKAYPSFESGRVHYHLEYRVGETRGRWSLSETQCLDMTAPWTFVSRFKDAVVVGLARLFFGHLPG